MEGSNRHLDIIEQLRTTERVTVAELAARTGCSEMTIRRDLDQLAEQGVLRRVRGGAVSLLLRGEAPPFAVREHEAADVKRRIGAKINELVADGESVILDSGTTALHVAHALAHRRITAIPLDLHSVNALSGAPDVRLLVPGGQMLPGTLSLAGYLTENALRALRVDTAILAVCGLSARHGLTAPDLAEVPIKQTALAAAQRKIAVCDGSKFSRTGLGHVCSVTELDAIVTDDSAPSSELEKIEAAGVTVILV
ncbi:MULTISPECIES: DeoR/GlpR family DNA-binding transcription regulator [Actinomadura]|uniref:Lactose phosphotransferase system repressor n=1 Tax=Actinomadura litoris TaxID=2678616 RepID=A0A7K1L3R7_9ACTN|nr:MULTISPECIES: DeoR/GlpR family DNA-binding transcription regulator [Actinomadura]MBT2210105.1 DeoR/GlpR family DNA-binding transcription regulator [Actinomadura sp. NEAU-AAG7]MUN39074.1 DeoR family transcriptional regulator [Actinomadura litoris]